LKSFGADWRILILAGGALIAAGAAVVFAFFRRPSNPQEAEHRRRSHLNQIGRICEGQVVDLFEQPAETERRAGSAARGSVGPNNGGRRLVCYSYSISGVTFQTAQDTTDLLDRIRFNGLVAGQPTSVKYDPSNPSNSILIAEDWSGLR
jgi:hypothetical protein